MAEKYYQMEIQTLADGSIIVGATADYDNALDAEAGFYSKCSSAIAAIKEGTLKACLVKTFGATGADIPDMTKYFNDVEPVPAE